MKSYNDIIQRIGYANMDNVRAYKVDLPAGKDPEGIDITWYFDADVSCVKFDDGNYYAISRGQGDPQYTTEILPVPGSTPTIPQTNIIPEAMLPPQ